MGFGGSKMEEDNNVVKFVDKLSLFKEKLKHIIVLL